jgi:hypothetical protein
MSAPVRRRYRHARHGPGKSSQGQPSRASVSDRATTRDGNALPSSMSVTYAKAVRDALPHAQLLVDRIHLVKRANQMVEAVRPRTTWDSRGRPGRRADPEWVNRRRLLRWTERRHAGRLDRQGTAARRAGVHRDRAACATTSPLPCTGSTSSPRQPQFPRSTNSPKPSKPGNSQ